MANVEIELKTKAGKVGIQINAIKTKMIELINSEDGTGVREGLTLENVSNIWP